EQDQPTTSQTGEQGWQARAGGQPVTEIQNVRRRHPYGKHTGPPPDLNAPQLSMMDRTHRGRRERCDMHVTHASVGAEQGWSREKRLRIALHGAWSVRRESVRSPYARFSCQRVI